MEAFFGGDDEVGQPAMTALPAKTVR